MNKKIEFPEQKTFFICWNGTETTITSYGIVETYQCMETKQPILNQYVNEEEWVNILIENGIDPYPDNINSESPQLIDDSFLDGIL